MRYRALILDYGCVLSELQGQAEIDAMARTAGVPLADFERGYWKYRKEFDNGWPPQVYWTHVLQEAGAQTVGWEALMELDLRSWTHYRDEVWHLTRDFRQDGGLAAMLTNNIPPLVARIDHERPLADWFDAVVASYEVGVLKPHPRIYQVCLEKLGVAAAEALFVDDREENVAAAVDLGLHGLCFTEAEGLARLREATKR